MGAYRSKKIFLIQKSKMSSDIALASKHSKRYSGVVNKKAIAVAPASDNKGFTVTIKKGSAYRPGNSTDTVTFKAGPRRSLHKVKDLIVKQRYRKDLTKVAMQRAAAIVRSQKALPVKKAAAKKSE